MSGGQQRAEGVSAVDWLQREVTHHRTGARHQELVVVEECERTAGRASQTGRRLKEIDGERDCLGLVLRLVTKTVAPGITDRRDAKPERFELTGRARLPAMSQFVSHGVP